jgi:hypothetical protein
MERIFAKIILISAAVFCAGFLSVQLTQAVEPPLVVQFEDAPLFDEANFLPDDAVSRWVKVTNNSGETQRIATEAINESDPDDFATQLNLTIKEGDTVIFNDTLAEFFSQGETYLSSLANGAQVQYDFTIVFNSGAGNDYQEKMLGFDILVGFEGTEGGLPLPNPGGGTGDGDGLPPGLTIVNEGALEVATTSVTITWNTSYPSTSQVIYALAGESHFLDLTDNGDTPPKYGYERTTAEYDISPKVTYHSVTILGLTPDATYYYRAVSHASLAVSTEHSFTTLTEASGGTNQELALEISNEVSGEITQGDIQPGQGAERAQGEGTSEKTSDSVTGQSIGYARDIAGQAEKSETDFGAFLAAISDFFSGSNLWWLFAVVILILIVLFFLSRKKKKTE